MSSVPDITEERPDQEATITRQGATFYRQWKVLAASEIEAWRRCAGAGAAIGMVYRNSLGQIPDPEATCQSLNSKMLVAPPPGGKVMVYGAGALGTFLNHVARRDGLNLGLPKESGNVSVPHLADADEANGDFPNGFGFGFRFWNRCGAGATQRGYCRCREELATSYFHRRNSDVL